jgi:hypothetical protein
MQGNAANAVLQSCREDSRSTNDRCMARDRYTDGLKSF